METIGIYLGKETARVAVRDGRVSEQTLKKKFVFIREVPAKGARKKIQKVDRTLNRLIEEIKSPFITDSNPRSIANFSCKLYLLNLAETWDSLRF